MSSRPAAGPDRHRRSGRAQPPPAGPLLCGVVIARDEADNLPGCLAALAGVVDEIVVYDTGSLDGTVALARAAGARVVEGYWDDDFAAARNRALAACTGRWVLSVDADEQVEADPPTLRRELARSRVDGFVVTITNLEGAGGQGQRRTEHRACRLFRRTRARWAGRLHERVESLDGRPLALAATAAVRLTHSGYLAEAYAARGKAERNLALARAAAADVAGEPSDTPRRNHAMAHLARARLAAGDHADALAAAREVGTADPELHLAALWVAAQAGLALGDLAAVEAAVAALRRAGRGDLLADHAEVRLLAARDQVPAALGVLARIPDSGMDGVGFEHRREHLGALPAELAARDQRPGAAGRALAELAGSPVLPRLGLLVDALRREGRPLADLAAALPGHLWRPAAAAAGALADDGPELLEAMWAARPGDRVVLAAAGRLGPRLPLLAALEWSARLRAAGATDACPLLALAAAADRPARDRVLAAAIAWQSFADPRAEPALEASLALVPAQQAPGVLAELRVLAPALLAG